MQGHATWSQRVLEALLRDPQAPAIISSPDGCTWTAATLLAMAAGANDLLDAHQAAPGQYVPALLSTRPASVAMLLAGAWSRRPLAPLGPRMTERELLSCLERLDRGLLLTEPQWADKAAALAAETGRRVAVLENLAPGAGPPGLRGQAGVAFMMHTSGTTGAPKQVPVAEAALARRAEVNGALLQLTRGARLAIAGLFHHVAGLGNIAVALGNQAAIVMYPSFSVAAWRDLAAVAPTHTVTVPSVIETLLNADALTLPSLQVLCYGGSPMHPETVRRVHHVMPEVALVELFGQTEGSPLTVLSPQDHLAALTGQEHLLKSVGRPAPGVELRIHDPGADGVGEVWARCRHSFLTDADGWQHTGDLGRLVDGYLYLVGRQGDKIIRGGENVFPVEVEQVLESHPGVVEAAVVGVPDQRLGETIHACIVAADPASPPSTDELRAFCRERLAGFKVPAQWTFRNSLPRNAAGKVLRQNLVSSDKKEA
jgi:acyl-CoA synthetase (AMP-forming)/AMP-acid ligase II